jgi:hypothetical protein
MCTPRRRRASHGARGAPVFGDSSPTARSSGDSSILQRPSAKERATVVRTCLINRGTGARRDVPPKGVRRRCLHSRRGSSRNLWHGPPWHTHRASSLQLLNPLSFRTRSTSFSLSRPHALCLDVYVCHRRNATRDGIGARRVTLLGPSSASSASARADAACASHQQQLDSAVHCGRSKDSCSLQPRY